MLNNYHKTFILFLLAISLTSFVSPAEKNKIEAIKLEIKKTTVLLEKTNFEKQDISKNLALLETQINNRNDLIKELKIENSKSVLRLQELQKYHEENFKKYNELEIKYFQVLRNKWKNQFRENNILNLISIKSLSSKIQSSAIRSQFERKKKQQLQEYSVLLKDYFVQLNKLKVENNKIAELESNAAKEAEKIQEDMAAKKKLLLVSASEIEKIKINLQKLELEKQKLTGIISSEIERTEKFKFEARTKSNYNWASPLRGGTIISKFGKNLLSDHLVTKNNGIDIQSSNAFVQSTNAGEVVQIRQLPNQSYMILIRHSEYYSVYSNLESVLVRNQESIEAGANLGKCMPSSNGQFELHFEIWQGKTPQNPVDFIR